MASPSDLRLDAAFDRIEGAVLPSIGALLRTLLDAAEAGAEHADPEAQAVALRGLALELEALTREIGSLSPDATLPGRSQDVDAA